MKKLTLVLGMALCTSFAFAQTINYDIVTQTGNENSSLVNQDGATSGGTNNNWASVTQDGNNNVSSVQQFADDVWADGGHWALVLQEGNRNLAIVDQLTYGADNNARIETDGDDNYAYIGQRYASNVSTILQEGNYNRASSAIKGSNLVSYIDQTGNWNEGYQAVGWNQSQDSYTGRFEIIQDGTSNYAEQVVTVPGGNWGNFVNNNIAAYQDGDDNTALQTIGKSTSNNQTGHNTLDIDQLGNSNIAYQIIKGGYNTATTMQNLNSNQSFTYITGQSNTAITIQN